MSSFVAIYEGPTVASARILAATSDPETCRAVLRQCRDECEHALLATSAETDAVQATYQTSRHLALCDALCRMARPTRKEDA